MISENTRFAVHLLLLSPLPPPHVEWSAGPYRGFAFTHSDWVSERDFSSSVDFWITTNQALNQSKKIKAATQGEDIVIICGVGGDGFLFFMLRFVQYCYLMTSWVQHQQWGLIGFGFQVLFTSFPLDRKITFYRKRTVMHWVEHILNHPPVCTLNTMSLISNLTEEVSGIM